MGKTVIGDMLRRSKTEPSEPVEPTYKTPAEALEAFKQEQEIEDAGPEIEGYRLWQERHWQEQKAAEQDAAAKVAMMDTPYCPAQEVLKMSIETIAERGVERDAGQERSMRSAVRAFNGMFDTHLTEEQGWMFMVLLKMSRSKGGTFNADNFVDGAAYFALAAEPAQRE